MEFNLRERTILLVIGGSRAYGMHRQDSDVDLQGIAVPPREYFHGFSQKFDQADSTTHMQEFVPLLSAEEQRAVSETKVEGTVFNLTKFISLAVEANPNIWNALFTREEEVRLITPLGRKLREHRDLFISAKARFSFAGYAHAQLKRIKGHRAYLLNPPDHRPTRAEFGLPENTLIPADQLSAAEAAVRKRVDQWSFDFSGLPNATIVSVENQIAEHLAEMQVALGFEATGDMKWLAAARLVGLDSNLIYVMQKEREYSAAHTRWKQYHDWKTNRNEARAALEAKNLFDTKHGAHLIRLLKMCREILTTGKVNVWRGAGGPDDAQELLDIRNGAWTYERVVEWAEKEDAELEALYRANQYIVPKAPDRDAINKLCVELVETALSEGVS